MVEAHNEMHRPRHRMSPKQKANAADEIWNRVYGKAGEE